MSVADRINPAALRAEIVIRASLALITRTNNLFSHGIRWTNGALVALLFPQFGGLDSRLMKTFKT